MKILLFGEYSNVHWTLRSAFRELGHEAIVVSDGDDWKNYERDINISYSNKLKFLFFIIRFFFDKRFKNNDIVQIISYRFLFKNKLGFLNKFFFNYLKKNNKKIVLGAFGDDYFYIDSCIYGKFKYSPISEVEENDEYVKHIFEVHYSKTAAELNKYIAYNSDGIVSCMYEYFVGYEGLYKHKLANIQLPINTAAFSYNTNTSNNNKLNIFFGIQKARIKWKGSDVILRALNDIKIEFPEISINIVENIPYDEYKKLFSESNLFFDQAHSYSQGMNGLIAMASGKILFGGGEQENYELLGEDENFPVVNITSDVEDIKRKVKKYIEYPDLLEIQGRNSFEYIMKHHNSIVVANKYLKFYHSLK